MSLFFLWGPSFMAEDGPKIIRFGPNMVPVRDGKMFVIITIFTYCLVIVLSVAWMGVLLCGPRVPRGRICISLYSNQGYQGGEGDGGSFIKLGEVIAMKISLK